MIENVFERLVALFTDGNARFRVVEHEAAATSPLVAAARGTELGQGAKALACCVKGNGIKQHVLAVLPGDQQADLSQLAAALGARRASLVDPETVKRLTGCVIGSVPPVSFHKELLLVTDPYLFKRYEEIAFNAGKLDVSIIINAQDFERIVKPKKISFRKIAS